MKKLYLSAPLPFMGQKRLFAREFINVLKQFDDCDTFVDLFGGSGLLSHIVKHQRPDATVVYNDFDNYRCRLDAIPRTNVLLADLRKIVENIPRHKIIPKAEKERIFDRIAQEEKHGYVDYITLSSSLMFSMKYKTNLADMQKESLYNNIRTTDYPLCPDYLNGLTITNEDYKTLFSRYHDKPNVAFLVDPPYLSSEVGSYSLYWKLSDYLDVLTVLQDKPFIYFTSDKSSIIELCDWIGTHPNLGNPFANCQKREVNAHMNHNSHYTDIMLYTTNRRKKECA